MKEPLGIVGVGLLSPVGLDAEQTTLSIRAGLPRKEETPFLDQSFEPIVVGHLPSEVLPPLREGLPASQLTPLQARLLRLATPALHEVLGAEDRPDEDALAYPALEREGRAVPLLLAAARPPAQPPEIFPSRMLSALAYQVGAPIDVAASRVWPTGQAGFFTALAAAHARLTAAPHTDHTELVAVGGVDSYFDLRRLGELDAEARLLTTGPQDAFIPGEGAAFLLLASRSGCRAQRRQPLAWIRAIGQASEPGHRGSDVPYRGDGLAAAVGQVFAQLDEGAGSIARVMAGFNGESFHCKEWGVAHLRNSRRFAESLDISHPAEYTGDMGAALAPMMAIVAALDLAEGTTPGPVLVWASSDGPERGAIAMTAA